MGDSLFTFITRHKFKTMSNSTDIFNRKSLQIGVLFILSTVRTPVLGGLFTTSVTGFYSTVSGFFSYISTLAKSESK